MREIGRLDSKVALVTGASSGMGYEIAKLFAKEGASVVVIARRKERLADLIAQIEADGGKSFLNALAPFLLKSYSRISFAVITTYLIISHRY